MFSGLFIKILKGTNGKHGLPEEAHSSDAYISLHPNGNTKQLRVYNKNLTAKTDIEYSVHQGKMTFHAHDYVNGIRQPARSLTSEKKRALWEIFWRYTMTKQEFNELYDSLYYGHDVELTIAGKHYFSEWNDAGIELYLTVNGEGTKISSISALDKSDILAELFEFMFVEQKNPNNSYADFEIVDIE